MIEKISQLVQELKASQLTEHRFPNIELKPDWHTDYGAKISGLANKSFEIAWLVVGVDDKGVLCGHDEKWAKNREETISQQVNNFLNPVQAIQKIECVEINTAWAIVICITPPGAVTYWKETPYKMAGTTCLPMLPEEIMEFTVRLPGLHDFSAQKWDGDYDASLVLKFAEIVSLRRKDSSLEKLSALTPDQILERIGISHRNVTRILFGDFKFRVVYYNDTGDPVEHNSDQGLFKLLSDEFIQTIQRWSKNDSSRQENQNPENAYPNKVLKEAITNAVAHAAYFEKQGDIVIEVFRDKLVITNSSLPQASFFANKWFSRSRNTINNLLMETLRLAGYADELGRGKEVIFYEMIKAGRKPPIVSIEKAGQYNRWRLYLYDIKDGRQLRLFTRIKDLYSDEHKALIANALVLWSNEPVSNISKYIDGESKPYFEEILKDLNGPVFFYEQGDKLTLHRWVRILLEEGKDSKTFTMAEEEGLRKFAYDIQTSYHDGFISPKELRQLAHMGETDSEKALSSKLLGKWKEEGHVELIRKGVYKFKVIEKPRVSNWSKILEEIISSGSFSTQTGSGSGGSG